jgi:hypothetical protein
MSKKPSANFQPDFKKSPRVEQSIASHLNQYPSWQLKSMDIDGNWSWANITQEILIQEILPKLKNFESMYWREILNRKNHEIPISAISKEAQKRLAELKHFDIENVVSLRLTGPIRIWGIRSGSTLRLLWWDPDHTVYLYEKPNT